jgi:hypothetical protein
MTTVIRMATDVVKIGNTRLSLKSEIKNFVACYQLFFVNESGQRINCTKKYYDFLTKHKAKGANWRFRKNTDEFTTGFSGQHYVFACLTDEQLIDFTKGLK